MTEQNRSRNWCFTWNNYPTDVNFRDEPTVMGLFGNFKYIVLGFEVGESGTRHIQGYVDFRNARTLSGLKKIDRAIHWEVRRGSWDEAVEYCKKDGNWVEFGTPNEQGKRTDLVELKNNILNGLRVDHVVLENPIVYHQYGRTLNKIEDLAMRRRYRTQMTEGFWYWGETGVGKSHTAFEGYTPETHYLFPNDNGWWDGYTQQETVIFNDFRGEIPYNEMLQIVDKWPYSVRRRNREPMPFTSRKVIVTSSLTPEKVYCRRNKTDALEQLLRRFVVIRVRHNTQVVGGVILCPPTIEQPLANSEPSAEAPLRGAVEDTEDLSILTLMTANELSGPLGGRKSEDKDK